LQKRQIIVVFIRSRKNDKKYFRVNTESTIHEDKIGLNRKNCEKAHNSKEKFIPMVPNDREQYVAMIMSKSLKK